MSVALILLSLMALCLGTFGWLWLCAGFRRGGPRGALGKAALQVSGLCLAYGLVRGQALTGLYMATFPPLALAEAARLVPFSHLMGELVWPVAPWAGAVLVAALAVRVLRPWAPGLALLAAMVAAVVLGGRISEAAMCRAAAAHGIATFSRLGFADSLTMGQNDPGAVHALADSGDVRLGWSFRRMNWHVLPADSPALRPAETVVCPG